MGVGEDEYGNYYDSPAAYNIRHAQRRRFGRCNCTEYLEKRRIEQEKEAKSNKHIDRLS